MGIHRNSLENRRRKKRNKRRSLALFHRTRGINKRFQTLPYFTLDTITLLNSRIHHELTLCYFHCETSESGYTKSLCLSLFSRFNFFKAPSSRPVTPTTNSIHYSSPYNSPPPPFQAFQPFKQRHNSQTFENHFTHELRKASTTTLSYLLTPRILLILYIHMNSFHTLL